MAIYHVFSAIRPEALQKRLNTDLKLSNYELREDSKKFMEEAIKLSLATQIVNNGPPKKPQTPRKRNDGGTKRNKNGNGKDYDAQNKTLNKDSGND